MTSIFMHDRYDLLRPLARGGMAMVYLTREVDTGREVALKQLALSKGARLDEWRLRFQHEFHVASRLRHPHLVATYDYAEGKDGVPFFTMEYLPGPGLEDLMPLGAEALSALLPGLLRALAYLHHQGLVHCDLKPENIRLGPDGQVRLMDLGLVTRAGQVIPGLQGSLPYMPPEVIRHAPIDRRSDLYALGAVLYHLLTGRPPFLGDPRAVLRAHLEEAPPPLREVRSDLPAALEVLVGRLLEKDPRRRFQSADEVLQFLGEGGDIEDDQTLFHPPLLGRQAELEVLAGALARARAGACEEVWLTGDAEVGLSPVLEEFCCRAQLAGASVLRGAFQPGMGPFEGLRGVVRGLVALARHQTQAIAHLTPVLVPVLPELGQAPAPDGGELEHEKVRLFEALTRLLRLAASGPLVLAFTDVHWAEPAWREWLEYVRRNAPDLPVLVVATHAGEPDLDLDLGRSQLEVFPLGRDESHEAILAILGATRLSEPFMEQACALTGGYIVRLEALLRRLAAAGELRRHRGAWVLPEAPLAGVLAALDPEWALSQRLEALSPCAKAVLTALVVRGRETALFELMPIVRRIEGRSDDDQDGAELFEALRALEEGGWIVLREGACSLSPERDRQALLRRLSERRRMLVHQAIAETLEQRLPEAGDDPALLGEVAVHALAAGDARRGPTQALAAARRRARLFDLEGAESLAGRAIELLEASPQPDASLRLGLHRLRADVARLAGDRRLALHSYQRAIKLATQLGDQESLASLENGLGRLMLAEGQLKEAEERFRAVLNRLGEDARHLAVAQAHTLLGRVALTQGDLAAASDRVQQALALAGAIGHRPLLRENMAQLGYLYVASGERAGEGLGLLAEALQMTEKDEAKLQLNVCYALLGRAQLLLGHFVEAKLAFQRNCDLCAELGAAPHDEATAFMHRATVELALGDYRGARRSAAPAAALARMIANKPLQAQARLLDGMAALYQGDSLIYQDATNWVADTIAATGSDYLQAMGLTHRAEAEGFLGDWGKALSSANQALEAIARGAGHEYGERARLIKGEALWRLGLYKPARQELEGFPTPQSEALHARLLLALARLESLDGREALARALGVQALSLAQHAGVVPVAAECCLLLARLADDRAEALSLSRKALLDAEACGSPAQEAEALYQASRSTGRPAQAADLLAAAEEAWQRAIAGLNPSQMAVFSNTEERRPLRDALAKRKAEGYRPTAADHQALLEVLAQPPEPARLLPAIAALCRARARHARVAIFWPEAPGALAWAYAEGSPLAGTPEAELAIALEGGEGVVCVPLLTAPDAAPWGYVLTAGVSAEEGDRLAKLLPYLAGALWAAHRLAAPGLAPPSDPEPSPPAEDLPRDWPRLP